MFLGKKDSYSFSKVIPLAPSYWFWPSSSTQNPIQLPTHQIIPLPTTPNQETKVDINNINNSNEMDNDFFETMTNEIFNDNNPNVEKKNF
jgi:hypothetical protein